MEPELVLDLDVVAMGQAFEKKELTPKKATEIFIAHHKRLNPSLNIVVEDRYDKAIEEAIEYTKQYADGNTKGVLAGIPMSIKESFNVSEMHTTGGMVSFKNNQPCSDAEAVARLKREGAVILCKTNIPTLNRGLESDNNLFGKSCNPWNPPYTTGGSSGGEAALIAVGGAAAGFGSDIGGSIRIPSHFNGVVGFKAGAKKFPEEGYLPKLVLEKQRNMIGYGPITKSVRDAALIYSVIFPQFKIPQSFSLPENLRVVTFDSLRFLLGLDKIKNWIESQTSQIPVLEPDCHSFFPSEPGPVKMDR